MPVTLATAAEKPPVLRVSGLSVEYGSVRALTDVSFCVGAGQLVAVVGPNGAGKSTLFRAVCGLVAHTGEVALRGIPCHHRRDHLSAAYIPQRSAVELDFPLTLSELVVSGRRRFRRFGQRPTITDRAAARRAMQEVGLAGLSDRPLGTLSGGELQRGFLARALAQEADLILLDEAFSGVDRPGTESLLDLLAQLAAGGTTVLVATHDLMLARRRFGRCLAVHHTLVADGRPVEVLGGAALDAIFGSASHVPQPVCR